jgi:formate dehydrogenase subunit gamma
MSTTLEDSVHRVIQQAPTQADALIPLLHDIQGLIGHIPQSVVPLIASHLNLSRAEVYGVISFYHDFRQSPPGRKMVRICIAEACQSMGAQDLMAHAQERLGLGLHETHPSGSYSLEPTYCLGLCACAPAMMINDELVGRLTKEKLSARLDQTPSAPKLFSAST